MIYTQLLTEIGSGPLIICESANPVVEALIERYRTGINNHPDRELKLHVNKLHENMISSDDISASDNPFDSYEENSVVVIPIMGMMTKYGYIDWDEYRRVFGMDTVAKLIKLADKSSKISGIVLLCNTPGGTTQSIYGLEDALRNRIKPVIGLIDGMCMSGGIYTLSFCDKIFATHRMCEIGSIGTFAKILDNTEMLKKEGLKVISVYPPESSWKNKAVREAIEGKTELLIDESLTPFAIHFQNIIKENRPKLDTAVEGILEGREFYAYDAITHKLIDGLRNIDQAIEEVHKLAKDNKKFYSQFN
jgi:protease-4